MWIVLVTLLSLSAFASGEGYGNVGGRVLDQTGRPLPGVSVALASTETTLTTTSELDGTFRFERVPPGSAELTLRPICRSHAQDSSMSTRSATRFPARWRA